VFPGKAAAYASKLRLVNAVFLVSMMITHAPTKSRSVNWKEMIMAMTPVQVKQNAPAPSTPPDVWRSLRTEMDRLFDRFTSGFGTGPFFSARLNEPFSVASPAVDITEDDSAFKLSAELPGMTDKDIQVSVSGDTLTITGEKQQEREEKQQNYHLTERSYGQFRRSFYVPEDVDRDKIEAAFANGVLNVTMPKSAQVTPKKIEVKTAA
jgi:HSP20 family protein